MKNKYFIKIFIVVPQTHTEGQFSEVITEEHFKRKMYIFCIINSLKIPIWNVWVEHFKEYFNILEVK